MTSQIVGHPDFHPVDRIVIGHAVDCLTAVRFLHQVVTRTGRIVIDGREREAAVFIVFLALQPFALVPIFIGLIQLEAEGTFGQNLANQVLVAGNLGKGRCRNIAVGKGDAVHFLAANDGGGNSGNKQVALQIIVNGDGHHILGLIEDDAIIRAAGVLLRDLIVIRTRFREG